MFKNAMKTGKQLPFEQQSLTDEQFEVFARLTSEQQLVRKPGTWSKLIGRVVYFTIVVCFVYFFLVGRPFWDGAIHWFWRFYNGELVEHSFWGMVAFIVAGTHRNILPQILCTFDRSIPGSDPETPRDASECCIVIPCYKAAETLRSTIPACLKIFRPEQIFIIANGNSPTPLDHTADVCAEFGVRHFWVPVGSKITAEFVGVAVARGYKYVMLIDDDVLLPENLPLPTHHFDDCDARNRVACVGYTIKSVGANSTRGTLMQMAQDLEYKVSGLAKVLQTHYGSVVFPHGAIALWRRDVLEKIFHAHPGYHISEDWYLGHTARAAGYRMVMSSEIFVETETPPSLFPPIFRRKGDGGSRGGYGEMTIYKQRFYRWNFFFLFRIYNNMMYILLSWRLGWREIITKIYVFGECYDSIIRLIAPVVLPVALAVSWRLTLIVTGALLVVNWAIILFFNFVHLGLLRRGRPDEEQVPWIAFFPYIWLKFAMVWVNVASVYWSIYEYVFFFTQQHLMVTENVLAWQVIRQSNRGALQAVPVVDSSASQVQ